MRLVRLSTMTVSVVVVAGRSASYVGVQLRAVYAVVAVTLFLLP